MEAAYYSGKAYSTCMLNRRHERVMSAAISREEVDTIEQLADKHGCSMASIVRDLSREYSVKQIAAGNIEVSVSLDRYTDDPPARND